MTSSDNSERPRTWDAAYEDWANKAGENLEKWGHQNIDTLLLATQEELGELSQAFLEARDEGGDPEQIREELDDLAALMFQIQFSVEYCSLQSTTKRMGGDDS
ncbi:hypothetical protein [Halomontanus rarus]|uniref:hypothetical protein n=1 Tax=Halomontanus rarus TaxID=3034020 RepID=UPI0023E7D2D3|nr:hypothetical protein [Halovivax sp. TS33]